MDVIAVREAVGEGAARAVAFADGSPFPDVATLYEDVYAGDRPDRPITRR